MTRTGWDMDPFVVMSFGKKVFRTRVIRHSLNPTWEEKLLFHVRRYETAFKVQLTVLDWDKLSSNDHVGDARFDVSELVKDAPQPDPNTGLYDEDDDDKSYPMKEYRLPLVTAKEVPWESKHNPVLHFRSVLNLLQRDCSTEYRAFQEPGFSLMMRCASGFGHNISGSMIWTIQMRSHTLRSRPCSIRLDPRSRRRQSIRSSPGMARDRQRTN